MFEDIYIFYVLSKYKLGLMSRNNLFNEVKDYVKSKGPIFIKLLQVFLHNRYTFGSSFSEEEINTLTQILDKVHHNISESDFEVGCGSVAYVYFCKDDNSKVIKRAIPNIETDIINSTRRFNTMLYLASFKYDLNISDESIKNIKNY